MVEMQEFREIFVFDKYIAIYCAMVVIDITLGLLRAFKFKNFKSAKMREGVIKVVAELMATIFGGLLDIFFGLSIFMISIKFLLIATQGLSIVENLAQLGFNVPSFIKDRLQDVKEESNKGVENNDNRN